MSNHGMDDEVMNTRMRELAKQLQLGATGRFPEGKLTPSDEGEIAISIGHSDGKVLLNFGKAIDWIGFPPEQAIEVARSLSEHANAILALARKGLP